MEVLAQSSNVVMETAVHAACRDVIIPAFDRCCQQLFTQIKDAFDDGVQQSACFFIVLNYSTSVSYFSACWKFVGDNCSLRDQSISIQLDCIITIRNSIIYICNKP